MLVRSCPGLPCDTASGAATPIELEDPLDPAKSEVVGVKIGKGRQVLRLIARSEKRPGVAWEALISGSAKGPTVIWTGVTGLAGDEGDRVVLEGTDIFVGKIRRGVNICGQDETILTPKRLDAASMTLRSVAFSRIPKAIRDAAPTLHAVETDSTPIGSVLGVRGASNNEGAAPALVDDDPSTAWFETRNKDGKGEFVVFSAPKSAPLEKLSIVLRPTTPIPDFAQPSWLWVVVDDATYLVDIPNTTKPGARVDVAFPAPKSTSCVAIALERADASGDVTVGLAEVDGVPVVPSTIKSLDDLITLLDSSGAEADLAEKILANAGNKGAKALIAKLGAVGDRGKERAVSILESTPCKIASIGLARLSWDAPKAIATAARASLDGCGREATQAIAEAFASGPDTARETLATRFAHLDPKSALGAILSIVPNSPAARRHTYRTALGNVAATSIGRDAIDEWLGSPDAKKPVAAGAVDPIIELARALAPLSDVAQPTTNGTLIPTLSKVTIEHAGDSAAFERRWLAAAPIAALAARGDVSSITWLRALFGNSDRYLRARAAEVAADVDTLRPELVRALSDKEPRVRQKSLEALRKSGGGGALSIVISMLGQDSWTFVRVSAAEMLGDAQGSGKDVDVALARATNDGARSVRGAALRALGARHASSQLPAIRSRALDKDEASDVRVDAVDALGKLCDATSVDDLFELAKRNSDSEGARQIALAAIAALGEIHPKDLEARLSTLDQSSLVVKEAVHRALKTISSCKA